MEPRLFKIDPRSTGGFNDTLLNYAPVSLLILIVIGVYLHAIGSQSIGIGDLTVSVITYMIMNYFHYFTPYYSYLSPLWDRIVALRLRFPPPIVNYRRRSV
jgi:hypothetical protein